MTRPPCADSLGSLYSKINNATDTSSIKRLSGQRKRDSNGTGSSTVLFVAAMLDAFFTLSHLDPIPSPSTLYSC